MKSCDFPPPVEPLLACPLPAVVTLGVLFTALLDAFEC